uniref:Putative secreted peptide n=1 Tax=Anopheles braziliensis TaxID=58242 RepID=A0A2M3ZQ16_9DIPT
MPTIVLRMMIVVGQMMAFALATKNRFQWLLSALMPPSITDSSSSCSDSKTTTTTTPIPTFNTTVFRRIL